MQSKPAIRWWKVSTFSQTVHSLSKGFQGFHRSEARMDVSLSAKPPNSGILFRLPMSGATVAAYNGVRLRARKTPA